MKTLENLEKLVGQNFDYDDITCCFEDTENEVIISRTENYSNFENEGNCQLIQAYENDTDSDMFEIWINEDNTIIHVC